jgi:hypothetical protein
MTGPHRHGPTRPINPNHPSVSRPADDWTAAARHVIDTCLTEHAALQRIRTTTSSLEAPRHSTGLAHRDQLVRAAADATLARRAAVAKLADIEERRR